MQQQDETIQAMRVFAFAFQDAVENLLRRNEVGVRLAGVVGIRARAGREVDEC